MISATKIKRRRCTMRTCNRIAIASVLCPGPFSSRPIFPTFPSAHYCEQHLDDYIHNYLAPRLTTGAIMLAQARRYNTTKRRGQ